MNIRKLGYELVSRIKNTPVNKFIKEFELSQEEKESLATKRLNYIVDHAKKNTVFYNNYKSFHDFPIISKQNLRDNYEDFLSEKINKKNSITSTTSGSSGRPMTFYLSKKKKYRQNAEVIFYNRWANIDIGDYHTYVRVTDAKSKLKLFIQNEILMNPKDLTDNWLREQVNILRNKSVTGIIGYPSAITAIAQKSIEMDIKKEDFKLTGIVTSGESLRDENKDIIEIAFGVEPLSRYSTEEFGVIASSCPNCGKYHLNDTGYIIEILSMDSDKQVNPGEHGRVVVTDLFSDNMPLIRFDTEDIAVYGGPSECEFYPTGITLESVVGRQIEKIYNINGESISPFAINGALRDFHSIKQFQFVQNTLDDNVLFLVVNSKFNKEEEQLISNRFKEILKGNPKIMIVNEIQANKSGKRPYIISNYDK